MIKNLTLLTFKVNLGYLGDLGTPSWKHLICLIWIIFEEAMVIRNSLPRKYVVPADRIWFSKKSRIGPTVHIQIKMSLSCELMYLWNHILCF